ncbi:hypothetical protein [Flammeovirga sp. OC4]|uniref:hypothetical protein n=1 Tax=Flammeovirga sp. OC4 TaxID=1382345 RepID=UPI0005C6BBB7|nr:hypothetical protein [Flammeovirga sp. OC4]
MDIIFFYLNNEVHNSTLIEVISDLLELPSNNIRVTNDYKIADNFFYTTQGQNLELLIEKMEMDEGEFRFYVCIYGNINKNSKLWKSFDKMTNSLKQDFGIRFLKKLSVRLNVDVLTEGFSNSYYYESNSPYDWILIKNGNDFEVKVYANLIIDWGERTIAPKIERKEKSRK